MTEQQFLFAGTVVVDGRGRPTSRKDLIMIEDKEIVPRSPDSVVEHFGDALVAASVFKPGMTLELISVFVSQADSDESVDLLVEVRLPNGSIEELVVGRPYHYDDVHDLDSMMLRMQRWTNLSPAGIRRRMRKSGFLPMLEAGDLEGE